jgi:hypothetical protein
VQQETQEKKSGKSYENRRSQLESGIQWRNANIAARIIISEKATHSALVLSRQSAL